MQLECHPVKHLTYCLNVHSGTCWNDQFGGICSIAKPLKQKLSPQKPFGLGLWLGARAADELTADNTLDSLRSFLVDNGMYVFSINAFPYGAFHGTRVKESVYQPDWRHPERMRYTCKTADILAALLPDHCNGSISTVPLGYCPDADDMNEFLISCIYHLRLTASYLHELEQRTGKHIRLALEPEPDCLLQNTDDCVRFFHKLYTSVTDTPVQRYIGICLDTCHFSTVYESPLTALKTFIRAGICIPKVQISAGIAFFGREMAISTLENLCEPVYLHQTRLKTPHDVILPFPDLPEAVFYIKNTAEGLVNLSGRIHFHIPLYFSNNNGIHSTSSELDNAFFNELMTRDIPHCEIETYTFHVLPDALKCADITESITREYQWTIKRMNNS